MEGNISVLISEDKITKRLKEIGNQISKDYEGKDIILVCVLKGSIYMTCELSKYIGVPVALDFLSVSSYGDGMESSGRIRILKDLEMNIKDKDVIIIEDIIDTGRTLEYLVDIIRARRPASLKICTLLDKPDRRIPGCSIQVDYTGFEIPDEFVVGYGLDLAQKYRNLPYIGVFEK